MLGFSSAFLIVAIVVVLCDFSPVILSEEMEKLLYVNEGFADIDGSEETDEKVFGTNTLMQEVNTDDLVDFDASKQAEEMLEQIYNGGK